MTALLLTLLFAQVPDESEEGEPPKLNVLSVELQSSTVPFSSVAFTYERVLAPQLSVACGLATEDDEVFFLVGSVNNPNAGRSYAGGLRALVRWYPGGTAPYGLWLAPMAAAVVADASNVATQSAIPNSIRLETSRLSAGGLIGFTAMLPFGAVVQVSGGILAERGTTTRTHVAGTAEQTSGKWSWVVPIAYVGAGWPF